MLYSLMNDLVRLWFSPPGHCPWNPGRWRCALFASLNPLAIVIHNYFPPLRLGWLQPWTLLLCIQCSVYGIFSQNSIENHLKENETLIFSVIVLIKSLTMIILVQKSCLHNDCKRNQSRTKIPYYAVVCPSTGGRHFLTISLDTAGLRRRVWRAGISKTIVS